MIQAHITRVITAINGFNGPAEGDLLVELRANGDSWILPPKEAIQMVRDNPRLEFTATEKWRLY